MPNGFSGRPAMSYLKEVVTAQEQAATSATRATSGANSKTNLNITPTQPPFTPEDAKTKPTRPTLGKGNSTNIVADRATYEEISRKISQSDDKIGECLYRIALEIENMCQNEYRLPEAAPRCMNISDIVKSSMGEFRSLTEDAVLNISSFAREITE